MRKIRVTTPALEKMWAQRLVDEASQFFTYHSLRKTDIGRKFSDKKGVWQIIGACQSKEIACKLTETGEIFGRSSWEISKILYPELHAKWETINKKRTSIHAVENDDTKKVEAKEEEVFDREEHEEEESELELDFSHEREDSEEDSDTEAETTFSDDDEDEDE